LSRQANLKKLNYLKVTEYPLLNCFEKQNLKKKLFKTRKSLIILKLPVLAKTIYATSSCSIRTKNKAKTRPGKTSVTTGVKIGGRKDALI